MLGVQLDVRNTFHAELVEHVHGRAEQLGYDVVLSTVTAGRDEQRAVTTLLDFLVLMLLQANTPVGIAAALASGGILYAATRASATTQTVAAYTLVWFLLIGGFWRVVERNGQRRGPDARDRRAARRLSAPRMRRAAATG